jgi:phosphoribosylformylglycinamidine synthase subunit PurS
MSKHKASIRIMLRKGILDVQGKAVEKALHSLEFTTMENVRIGKFVELEVEADSKEKATELIDSACKQLIANPIIEDYNIEIV